MEMNREALKRANTIEACISSAESNIARFEEIKKAKEVQIKSNDDADAKPIYITGKSKDKIMDILIEEWQIFRDQHLNELGKI
jgi:hypothetical protein